jgi:hypothetical protein
MAARIFLYALGLIGLCLSATPVLAQGLADMATSATAIGTMSSGQQGGAQQMKRAADIVNTANAAGTPAAAPASPASLASPAPAGAPAAAAAPGAAAAPNAAPAATAAAIANAPLPPPVDIHGPFKASFFFSPLDLIGIDKAIEGQQKVAEAAIQNQPTSVIPEVRKIKVGGISYLAPDNWVVWLNGQKVTPRFGMKEIVNIKVEKNQVDLDWFDIGANKVLKIRLRPHQVYDIVTGVLLPGI